MWTPICVQAVGRTGSAKRGLESEAKHTDTKKLGTLLWMVLLLDIMRITEAYKDNYFNNKTRHISELLNALLNNYDKNLRPGFGGKPLEVTTNILIRSMGPVSEERMMFSMDCYFRQTWQDERLSFHATKNITELRPSIKMLDQIWKPDTFFFNGRDSYLHTITYSNKLFRIKRNGVILYSQRLTIKSSCRMQLQKYPLDTQKCPLIIGSYGYTTKDVMYSWEKEDPVKQYKGITMSQFSLTSIEHGFNKTKYAYSIFLFPSTTEYRSVLHMSCNLKREIGYYLLQIYLPCYLIVIISWVSFWINREATPARVTLGITTVLTSCTIGISGREGIPKVPYSTALDVFLLMNFAFVFAALVEYAGVNYFTKSGHVSIPEEEDEDTDPKSPLLRGMPAGQAKQQLITTDINGHTMIGVGESRGKDSCWRMFFHCLRGNSKYRDFKAMSKSSTVSVSRIDNLAKFLFPFSFTCLNLIYWAGYLYYF